MNEKGKTEKFTKCSPTSKEEGFTSPELENFHINDSSMDNADSLQKQTDESKGLHLIGILAGVLGVFSIATTYGWLTGSWDAEHAIPTLIVIIVGGVVAYFATNSFGYTLLVIEAVGSVLLWIYAAIVDLIQTDFWISWIFTDLVLGLIVTIPLCAFPALVCAILITVLRIIIHAFKVES